MYSVIYTLDAPRGLNLRQWIPPRCKELWQCTEDGVGEYAYLDDECRRDRKEKTWTNGPHRKWVALLTEEQFAEFVEQCGLVAESVQTMGSLGAPGFGFGWAPAISFRDIGEYDAIQSAYVTPCGTRGQIIAFLREHERDIPSCLTDDPDQQHLFPEDAAGGDPWEEVKDVVLELYGNGRY